MIVRWLAQETHRLHRISLGLVFIWFGLLKPFGLDSATSIVAHTIWWGDPGRMTHVLGWWEVAIGVCLIVRPLLRVAVLLLLLRLPGILLAFILLPDVTFVHFPLAPTPEGQYLIKDLALFIAALAISSFIRDPSCATHRH